MGATGVQLHCRFQLSPLPLWGSKRSGVAYSRVLDREQNLEMMELDHIRDSLLPKLANTVADAYSAFEWGFF